MNGFEDALMEAVLEILSEKLDDKALRRVNTKGLKKKLLKSVTNELFYKLLHDQRVDLAPGFGSLVVRPVREKDKKVYDRRSGEMVVKRVGGKKIVYKPGDTIREFLQYSAKTDEKD